ncbi:MAG: ParB N-terminal domain-containing protein [Chloroflexi bacterium]|nr:ParB N-terminal domain-containing protein [Chloroflexota bacterium]
MNTHFPLSIRRNLLAYKFFRLRTRALNDAFRAMQTSSKITLEVFPGIGQRITPSLKLIGIQSIRVAEVVGTFKWETDFDHQFRPLQKRALNRWVNAYLRHEQNGWDPILAHKIDGKYFIEDGHHRVSVARFLGMEFIEATVWEYSSEGAEVCQDWPCCERSSSKAYAVG